MHFEVNQGQTDETVRFLARGPGYTLFLTPSEAVLSLRTFDTTPNESSHKAKSHRIRSKYENMRTASLRMRLKGADPRARMTGVDELEGKVNYFIGNDPAGWLSNVSTFSRVKYEQVYPGIDLLFYGNQEILEYDFIVAPSADPGAIVLTMEGADHIELDADGNLVAGLPGGGVMWRKPIAYQTIEGVRRPVESAYVLTAKREVAFQVGAYDPTQPLVIDPMLRYSTYLGGGNSDDSAWGIAVDANGAVYVTGNTSSTDFPKTTSGNLQGITGAFVTKFNPSGSNIVFSTYLSGNDFDSGQGIAVDTSSNVYVVGFTSSPGQFPNVNAYQTSLRGIFDIFLTKFNPSGSTILYSTYFGGTNDQAGYGVAVDTNGNAFVVGDTSSANFPVTNAFQGTYGGSWTNVLSPLDAVVAKFNTKVSGKPSLVYSTFLGAEDDDSGQGIAIDSSGNAYITGYSYSTNYPVTATALQTQIYFSADIIVSKLSANGSNLLYSTYLGGDEDEVGQGIAVNTNANIYLTGYTTSTNFPVTASAYQPIFGGGYQHAFITMLNTTLPTTNQVVYSTYLGGNNFFSSDLGQDVAVASNRFVHVVGTTGSTDFPISPNAFQQTYGGGNSDAFVAKIDPTASGSASLIYSSFLGGTSTDEGNAIAVDTTGNAYVAGDTFSTNFPKTAGAYRTNLQGSFDAFVAKIVPATDVSVKLSVSTNPVALGSAFSYTITVTNNDELAASNVTLTNILPSIVSYVSTTTTTGSCTQSGGVVSCSFGGLASGAGATISIQVNANTAGVATNIATVALSGTDGNPSNNAVTNVSAIGSVVSVSASPSNTVEQGSAAVLRFTRTGVVATPLTVHYTVSGTATPGADYTTLSGTAVLNTGIIGVLVNVSPFDDALAECPESVFVTLTPSANYAIGASSNTTVTIADNDLPTVTVAATTPSTIEGGSTNAVFTISRTGCSNTTLAVNYTVGGTATNGPDYSTLSGTANIALNSNSVRVIVQPSNDAILECPETVVLTVSTNAAYLVGSPGSDVVTVLDNERPTVTLAATTPNASEIGPTNGVFTLTRNGCTTNLLTVNYTISGTASNGLDYVSISGSADIPSGLASATVTIAPLGEGLAESSESVVLTLANSPNYINGSPANGTVTITDDTRPPSASFSASPTNGIAPLAVTFTDTSIGAVSNRFWSFGDGGTFSSPQVNVMHTYSGKGTNTVTLIATGPFGASTNTKVAYISVVAFPPGDVDGSTTVTTNDSLLINQVVARTRQTNDPIFQAGGFQNGDVNQDGQTGTPDSLLINQVNTGSRAYVVTRISPSLRSNNAPVAVTIYGVGFPTNTITGVTIGPPVSLNLTNIELISAEQIRAVVPSGGGLGTGTVSVVATPTNGVHSYGTFINK